MSELPAKKSVTLRTAMRRFGITLPELRERVTSIKGLLPTEDAEVLVQRFVLGGPCAPIVGAAILSLAKEKSKKQTTEDRLAAAMRESGQIVAKRSRQNDKTAA